MSTPWGLVTIDNVISSSGDLTQLYPDYCTPGTGVVSMGNEVREPVDGVLHRIEIIPNDSNGGRFELWDLSGLPSGASNNVNTGTALTDAYLQAQKALGNAKLIWMTDFKGDAGLANKIFQVRTPVMRGLAGRYILSIPDATPPIIAGSTNITLNIVADGLFRKRQIPG